ncbi:hypothetical protein BpHYR1_015640 [Brachionus plicatilis]|uniref:Uncharacterized protein n=1 Tax=Brachionus plicatilis TaxID=10195 RepID=A0A3M7PFW8_BRAPC|nr:hypothetical protein BpHYR1_015640 [Brachionus plicatilis]
MDLRIILTRMWWSKLAPSNRPAKWSRVFSQHGRRSFFLR